MKKKIKTIKWPDVNNYRELLDAAKTAPDAVAYKYEGEQVTYKDLLRKVDQVATGLRRVNIRRSDKVIVSLPDIPQAIECHYAMEKEGIHLCTLHPSVKAAAVAVIANEIGCKAIITVNEHYGEISKAIAGLDQPVQIILADVNIKKPKSKIRKSILRRKMQKKYAKDEHLTPWSKLISE